MNDKEQESEYERRGLYINGCELGKGRKLEDLLIQFSPSTRSFSHTGHVLQSSLDGLRVAIGHLTSRQAAGPDIGWAWVHFRTHSCRPAPRSSGNIYQVGHGPMKKRVYWSRRIDARVSSRFDCWNDAGPYIYQKTPNRPSLAAKIGF